MLCFYCKYPVSFVLSILCLFPTASSVIQSVLPFLSALIIPQSCLSPVHLNTRRLTFVFPLPLLLLAARLRGGARRRFALFGRARRLHVCCHLRLLLFSFLH